MSPDTSSRHASRVVAPRRWQEQPQSDVDEENDALAPYREAIAAIDTGAFGPAPGRRCPSCPFFPVCGA